MEAAYPQIAERLFGRAHAIEPAALRAIVDGPVARRIIAGELARSEPAPRMMKSRRTRLSAIVDAEPVCVADGIEYALTADGIAIVPVMGVLSQRFDWLAALCGWTTYEGLAATLGATRDDYRVKGILLDVESPGGEAAGMLDAADAILASRSAKPIWAVANVYAFSAAYAIAGAAEKLFVPRLGKVGSIGAVAIHIDESAADKAQGLKYTPVYSGARKVDGWSHAPLGSDAQSEMQRGVDYARGQFAALVGRQGRMNAAAAMKTEAAVYHDQEAVDAKLADAVGSFDDALAQLTQSVSPRVRGTSLAALAAAATQEMPEMTQAAEKPAPAPAATTKDTAQAAPQPPADANAASASAGAAPPQPAATKEKSETCPDCGREMVVGGEGANAPRYGIAAVLETLDLCVLAGATAATARGFIAAKTAIPQVREKLTAAKAQGSGRESELVPVPDKPAANAGWDDVVTKVNAQFGVGGKK
jgi:ClpP class serine protease